MTDARTWRVKTRVGTATWLGPVMTETEAVEAAASTAAQCRDIGDGGSFIGVGTRHGVIAWVRGRDVVSCEPVGPRWDGEEHDPRPRSGDHHDLPPAEVQVADLVRPPTDDDGTEWLRTRERQRKGRPTGVRP